MTRLLAALFLLSAAARADSTEWLPVSGGKLKARVFHSAQLGAHPRLVVVLHGDSPFAPPGYQYAFARRAAEALDDVVVAALLRPGYTDDAGDRSAGTRGETNGDNYTPAVIEAVAQAARRLADANRARAVYFVGHSGGAAIAADVLGRVPRLASGALLVACPCDVTAWRAYMAEQQGALWREPVRSVSPVDLVSRVSPATRVRMVAGAADPVAPPRFTDAYARKLEAQGVRVSVEVLPGLQHDILLEPAVIAQLKELLR